MSQNNLYQKKKPNRFYFYSKILQYTFPADVKNFTGRFIKEWKSIAQIETELGLDPGNIHRVCRGIRHHAYHSVWRYKEDCLAEDGSILPEITITRRFHILPEKHRIRLEKLYNKPIKVKTIDQKPEHKIKSNISDLPISQDKKSKPNV